MADHIIRIRTSCAGVDQFPFDDRDAPRQKQAFEDSEKLIARHGAAFTDATDKSVEFSVADRHAARMFRDGMAALGFTVE